MNHDLAIVGMVCCVPEAKTCDAFWQMLLQGKEGLRTLTEKEREACEHTHESMIFSGGFIDGIEQFDPECFGYTARDALFMDPQHRLFLQACLQALEESGNAGETTRSVGVFACASHNAYLTEVVLKQHLEPSQYQSVLLGNSSDCLATRVSYALNLTGPSMTIQSGCSSSLVALHQARMALLAKQCDVALVGGVSLMIPHYQGYIPVEGGFAAKDGHCRPFSKDATGTVFSSGYGVVVLKRLSDAVLSGDLIYATLKGTAINNDGSNKASFTAPSIDGQAQVIAKAWRVAGVPVAHAQYVETHGTGTPIGDPIELMALSDALQINSRQTPCVLGAVKANIGHLDVAAGIVGLIKTSLMLHHKMFSPQINFSDWNERILENTAQFQIPLQPCVWDKNESYQRVAGVSAFGFGGTNAHVVLSECIDSPSGLMDASPVSSLIVLSAKSVERLILWAKCLRDFLQNQVSVDLHQLAYSLQVGRRQYDCRYSVCVDSLQELIKKLDEISEDDVVICREIREAYSSNKMLEALQADWLAGAIIDWQTMYTSLMKKIHLPAAPLIQQSYWVNQKEKDANDSKKRYQDYRQWLYQTSWQEQHLSSVNFSDLMSRGLAYLSEDFVSPFLQQLKQYCQGHLINTQHLNLKDEDVYPESLPSILIHSLDLTERWEELPAILASLAHLVTTSSWISKIKKYVFVVRGMSDLFCQNHNPALSALLAFSRGIRQELPHLSTQLIDVSPDTALDTQVQQVLCSLSGEFHDHLVWRDGRCWQQHYQSKVELSSSNQASYFKPKGVYLITGGFGNVASVHVDFLATDYQATLVLVGRTALPNETDWLNALEDSTVSVSIKRRIQQILNWRARGFSVFAYSADITSDSSFADVCQRVQKEIGPIAGILHIAGVGSDMHYKVLSELTASHCQQLFVPKLRGLQVMVRVMHHLKIEQCLIISSISSALAGIGLAAYASVHNLLDAYVKKYHPTWRIMNWDAWNFHLHEGSSSNIGLGADLNKLAITFDEGLEVLRAAFKQDGWSQLYVSAADLNARVRQWVYRTKPSTLHAKTKKAKRPVLRSEYIKAATPLQQQHIDLWESLIGVEPIGLQDNFFELGGDSLLALELISQMQTTLQHTCSIMTLFEAGTIEKLVEKMQPNLAEGDALLSKVRLRAQKQRAALAMLTQ